MRAGVDIGGTFTDLVLSDGGRLRIHKLLSNPRQPELSMLAGLEEIAPGGLAALEQVAHGSTVATNAILERKGARTALITTAGFRDLLFIGRQDRPNLYEIHPRIPEPLVPRERCYEVKERLDHHGQVLTPLDGPGGWMRYWIGSKPIALTRLRFACSSASSTRRTSGQSSGAFCSAAS